MAKQTDRELLELAARAAGIEVIGKMENDGLQLFNGRHWNPLTDDVDVFRLAVKLGICFGPNFDGDAAVAFGREGPNLVEDHGSDPYAATRRAITLVAAAIGKAMPGTTTEKEGAQ